MIILFDAFGELGNRLVLSSILISIAKEENTFFLNFCFWRYARYFQDKSNKNVFFCNTLAFLSFGDQLIGEILAVFFRFSLKNKINYLLFDGVILARPSELFFRFLGYFFRKRNLILPGFCLQSHGQNQKVLISKSLEKYLILSTEYIEVHKHQIIDMYQPSSNISKEVKGFITSVRRKHKILIGCHIRKGDYKIYQNGKFYFEDSEYVHFMTSIINRLDLRNVSFILASNEDINLESFDQFSVYRHPSGHFVTDLYTLASCDYIIGVPSTFSGWASFVGQKPISFMSRNEDTQSLVFSDFDIWKPQFY